MTSYLLKVYKNCCTTAVKYPYMRHRLHSHIGNIQFCPFEDVLGIGHDDGYTSVLIPGKLVGVFLERVY